MPLSKMPSAKSPPKKQPVPRRRRGSLPTASPQRKIKGALPSAPPEEYPKPHPVAQRLHDTICQTVTGLRFHVAAIKRGLPPNCERVKAQCEKLDSQLVSASEELQEILKALRAGKL